MIKNLTCLYFSATDTTRRYVTALAEALNIPVNKSINLADDIDVPLPQFSADDLMIIAAPVYGGRLPKQVASRFRELEGNGAKAIALAVFGNRDYDDALLELTDILSEAGFNTIGAAAVVGQHSIFPKVAASRPDNQDIDKLNQFASTCINKIEKGAPEDLEIKGNRPYKKSAGVRLCPTCDAKLCNRCGTCAEKCPVGAISHDDVTVTEADRCLACGRCIHVCPKKARRHTGLKYKLIGTIFTSAFSRRKEPDYYTN